ncbi:phosphohydrolase [Candidatus Woesearchaeota archaeon CG10_big_fil_rev_8_21_14_0_10_36_11]|nr:MAG: phosphohydrolase [Candidatus Woesearchaeota archaeon CG10_big_fil_rev_8_21_14_0_10_36_11]
MNPLKIIEKYYKPESKAYKILVRHSALVAKKAIEIAKRVPEFNPDLKFIKEAAMLHDIGIYLTDDPEIYCYGDKEYICHGILGKEILEKEGFPKHAKVCERHIGVGISVEEIEKENLPIPKHDMNPISIEEQIICFADCFFSKTPTRLKQEKSLEQIKNGLTTLCEDKVKKFEAWCTLFKEN